MFVHDQTGGIFVNRTPGLPPVHAGELIDLEGIAELTDFAPQVNQPHWRHLGEAPLPVPRRVTYQEMASAQQDSRWVEVEGVVREIAHIHRNANENLLLMRVAMDSGEIDVFIPFQTEMAQNLVDTQVRIRGVCGADFNPKNQQIGVQIYVPDLKQITVIAPATRADVSPAPIDHLQRFGSRYTLGHRVKVVGTVTAVMPGHGFYMSDGSSGIYVGTRQEDVQLGPGDRVEALGFVEVFESHVRLADAFPRIISKGKPPQPRLITLENALTGTYDSELVSIEGRVLRSAVWRMRITLTLQQGQNILSVSPVPGATFADIPADGSVLRVTGILTDEIDSVGRVVAVGLLCRSAGDIVVVHQPPWWTLEKALAFLSLLFAIGVLILVWVWVLRRRVSEQTGVIRQKLLQEESLKEAAQAANHAKSDFLANMSHEIRTPMNAILGFADLLAETPLSEEQRDYIDTLRSSSQSLMRLLNEILDFSKIEAGQLYLEQSPFSLRECVQQTFRLIVPDAQRKDLKTALLIDDNVSDRLIGDSHRLQQVLLNLLSNAVKFTREGSVDLTVESSERDASAVLLHFIVRDTGIGVPPESQAKIFAAFQQADGSTTRKYGGTGLGLAICARLVSLFGGTIWVENSAPKGSKFHFTARFKIAPEPQETITPAATTTVHY